MSSLLPPQNILHKCEKPPEKSNEGKRLSETRRYLKYFNQSFISLIIFSTVFNEDTLDPHERSDEYYEKLLHSLTTDATHIPCNAAPFISPEKIGWVDQDMVKTSIQFPRKHLVNVILSQVTSYLIFCCGKNSSNIFYKFLERAEPKEINKKIFLVMDKVDKFFMLHSDSDEALRAFGTVRKALGNTANDNKPALEGKKPEDVGRAESWKTEVAKAIRADLLYIDNTAIREVDTLIINWNSSLDGSQFALSMQLFSGIFNMWFSSQKLFGIEKDKRMDEMKAVIHTWAVFGRLLGLHDEYNICSHLNPTFYHLIFRNIIVENLRNLDETMITMQAKFVEGIKISVPVVTYKALLFFAMDGWENFKGEHLWKIMSWRDKLALACLKALRWVVRNSGQGRIILNTIVAWWLHLQFWNAGEKSIFRQCFFPFC